MKNKLLILNIVSYIILYHLISESIYYFFIEKGKIGTTPIGFIISDAKPFKDPYLLLIFIGFMINMSVSGILLTYINKWKKKLSSQNLIGKLSLVFIITSFILLLFLLLLIYITNGWAMAIFIFFYFPMPIMVVLMIPLFKLNQWIIERLSK